MSGRDKKLHSWRTHRRSHAHQNPAKKQRVAPQEPGSDLRAGLCLLRRRRVAGFSLQWGRGHQRQRNHRILTGTSSPEGWYFGTKTWSPNSLQAPVLGCLGPNNQKGGNTAPSISREATWRLPEPNATSRHIPWHGPAHQRDKTHQ